MKIFYFVSGHGFGHISRSFEIIKEILKYDIHVYLFTKRIEFLKNFSHPNLTLFEISTDIGIIQNSSIDMDLEATKKAITYFEKKSLQLLNDISKLIEDYKPNYIVSDVSSFPFTLAKRYQIPSLFIGNFTWDFIYNNYAKHDSFFEDYSQKLRLEYGFCNKGFELPFSCPIFSIHNIQKIGLVGRHPTLTREESRNLLNFNDEFKYILLSFGAYGLDPNKFNFNNLNKNIFLVVSGLKEFTGKNVIHFDDFYYPNLLVACDAVLTKPGYGILSESYNTNCPIIYTDRGDFIEYQYLVSQMKVYHNSVYITQSELFDLSLEEKLKTIESNRNKPILKLENGITEIVKTFLI